jgi:protein SCO1/2
MYQMIYPPVRSILALALLLVLSACNSETPWSTKDITGFRPDLSFILTDANHNKPVQAEDFHGQLVVLNFGFTHCPDVCPLSLHQMQNALLKLGDSASQVKVLFVSVDPERDSLEALKLYTKNFGPQTIGLRGNEAAVTKLTQMYKISYGAEEAEVDGNYDVYHSSGMYVFDRNGVARLLVRPDDSVDAIANDLQRLLAERA